MGGWRNSPQLKPEARKTLQEAGTNIGIYHNPLKEKTLKAAYVKDISQGQLNKLTSQVGDRDKSKLARIPPDGPRVSGFQKWSNAPGSWDWPGVDTPDSAGAKPIGPGVGGLRGGLRRASLEPNISKAPKVSTVKPESPQQPQRYMVSYDASKGMRDHEGPKYKPGDAQKNKFGSSAAPLPRSPEDEL